MYSLSVIGILVGIGGMTATENDLDENQARIIWAISLMITIASFASFAL